MAKYKLTDSGVQDTETKAFIPNDAGNLHWQEYQEWLTQGSPLNVADPMDVDPVPTLDDIKVEAKVKIDEAAERARLRYITGGSGQAATYLTKYDEALAYKDAGYPAIGSPIPLEYIHIGNEAAAIGVSVQIVADTVIATRTIWVTVGGEIEGVRLGGKKDVMAAVDESGVDTVADATCDALNAL